jgi:signal transduction histidine kinase
MAIQHSRTNPLHQFVLGPETSLRGTVIVPQYEVGFWIHTGIGYLLVLGGTGYLGLEAYRSTGLRRKQTGLLTLSALPFFFANVLTLSDIVFPAYDLSPFGYLLSAVVFGVVLLNGRFLDITTVARRTAMAEMDEAVITLDEQDRVVDCNEAARELFHFGRSYHGIQAASFFETVPSEVLDEFADTRDTETEIAVPIDGTERHFLLSISPVGGTTTGGRVIVLREITSLKERENRLRRQNERLDEFASVVSHDLRNPLNVAVGNLQVMAESEDLDRITPVQDSLDRMETIIDDLLRLTKTGRDIDSTEPVDIDAVARSAWQQVLVDDSSLAVNATGTIEADRSRLRQLFENLFRNAAEHNDPPLKVTVEFLRDDGEVVGFAVADNGTGIPPAERETIFEHGYTTNDDGTGLGLSIVQNIVSAHGWEIAVTESSTGGTRFEIRTGS